MITKLSWNICISFVWVLPLLHAAIARNETFKSYLIFPWCNRSNRITIVFLSFFSCRNMHLHLPLHKKIIICLQEKMTIKLTKKLIQYIWIKHKSNTGWRGTPCWEVKRRVLFPGHSVRFNLHQAVRWNGLKSYWACSWNQIHPSKAVPGASDAALWNVAETDRPGRLTCGEKARSLFSWGHLWLKKGYNHLHINS